MCGRFAQFSPSSRYAELCGWAGATPDHSPRYNVAPTQQVLAIRRARRDRMVLESLRWGLIPSWSRGPDRRYSMINARAETVQEKPAYRSAFRKRRCLIPADGFFEWKPTDQGKTPYFIRMRDQAPFAMAGVWEQWSDSEERAVESCSIIVTDANPLMAGIHDRMPVILPSAAFGTWLDPLIQDPARLLPLLKPYPSSAMEAVPVSRRVNNPRNDDAQLLDPTGDPHRS